MQTDRFDYTGEREYYATPVTELRDWRWLAQDALHWIPDFPQVFVGKSVLDIGAGECLLTFAIAEAGFAKQVVGLELILHRMGAARQVNLPALGLVCGDCFRLPFYESSFDIVVGNGVLHHLPDEEAAVREVWRVLAPGGFYFGREPNFQNLAIKRRVLGGRHSPNEHVVLPAKIQNIFARQNMCAQIRYFWRRIRWLHHPWFSTSISITASKAA